MEYQKVVNLIDKIPNQSSIFRTNKQVETNDNSCVTYNSDNKIRFKTSMLKLSLPDYIYACIHVTGTTTIPNTTVAGASANDNKKLILRNFAPFKKCISKINNTQVGHAKDTNVVMLMDNLVEYSNIYSKTSQSLWQ